MLGTPHEGAPKNKIILALQPFSSFAAAVTIPGIEDYVSGANCSPEGLNQGYTHGLVMTFTDAAARDAYLPHPDHERVKQAVLPHVESVVVFDFEV